MIAKRSQREYILYHNNLRFVQIDYDVVNIRAFWSLEISYAQSNCTVDSRSFDNFLSSIYLCITTRHFSQMSEGGEGGSNQCYEQ